MNDDSFRVMDLAMQGYQCSQILMAIALDSQGKQNEDLLRAMSGLLGGMGAGKTCGVLTGACCVLGLYGGWGAPNAAPDQRLAAMLAEFVDWFDSQYTQRYGSIDCAGIVQDDMRNKMIRCPGIIIESLAKVKEILADHNYEFAPINPE
ncbi:MAG TPA: C-GCAxxG-C-C family protein [Acidobacteriaceae bacterium]|jgi:C_GCAxxG_C_C family probable redox protein|nr:C-GCAxxG-C-C family protein [Acidobacteriaceae bacterium]